MILATDSCIYRMLDVLFSFLCCPYLVHTPLEVIMAPPSFGPPGYSIPKRYRNRTPPPDGADTNTRPYMILFSYLLGCCFVVILIVRQLLQKHLVLTKARTAQVPP